MQAMRCAVVQRCTVDLTGNCRVGHFAKCDNSLLALRLRKQEQVSRIKLLEYAFCHGKLKEPFPGSGGRDELFLEALHEHMIPEAL
jgi:hypothetical protein